MHSTPRPRRAATKVGSYDLTERQPTRSTNRGNRTPRFRVRTPSHQQKIDANPTLSPHDSRRSAGWRSGRRVTRKQQPVGRVKLHLAVKLRVYGARIRPPRAHGFMHEKVLIATFSADRAGVQAFEGGQPRVPGGRQCPLSGAERPATTNRGRPPPCSCPACSTCPTQPGQWRRLSRLSPGGRRRWTGRRRGRGAGRGRVGRAAAGAPRRDGRSRRPAG